MNARSILVALVLALAAGAVYLLTRSDADGPSEEVARAAERGAAAQVESQRGDAELTAADAAREGAERSVAAPDVESAAGDVAERAEALERTASELARAVVRGRVVDADAVPVPGAELFLRAASDLGSLVRFGGRAPEPLGTSDADGSFELAAAVGSDAQLAVLADGFEAHFLRVPLETSATADVGDVVLDRGCVLEGRVVGPTGQPVANALLRVNRSSDGFVFASMEDSERPGDTRTDAGGNFRLAHVAAGPWRVDVSHPQHPRKSFDGTTEQPGERVTGLIWELDAGAEIAGRVLGWDGSGRLEVACFDPEPPPVDTGAVQLFGRRQLKRVDVEQDGSFRIGGLPVERELELELFEPTASDNFEFGMGTGRSAGTQPVRARAGEAGVTLFFQAGAALAMRVVDAKSGAPIEDYRVSFGPSFALETLVPDEGPPHADGRARFGNVRLPNTLWFDGDASGLVVARGYAPLDLDLPDLSAGGEFDLGTLRMTPVPQLTVRVTDGETGEPVEGARVELAVAADPMSGGTFEARITRRVEMTTDDGGVVEVSGPELDTARTDEDGVAVLDSHPGKRVDISVSHRDYAEGRLSGVVLPEDADSEHELALGKGGTVVVSVFDAAGDPLPGATVMRQRMSDADGLISELSAWSMDSDDREVTGPDGVARFERLASGTHAFKLSEASTVPSGGDVFIAISETGDGSWTELEVAEGETYELTLQESERFAVYGRVTEGGQPLVGARVSAKPKSDDPFGRMGPGMIELGGGGGERTDKDGDYRVEGLEPGEYVLTVNHADRALPTEVPFELVLGERRVDVDLSQNAIEGRVLGTDGKPLEGVTVRAERAEGEGTRARAIFLTVDNGNASGGVFDSASGGGSALTDADGFYRLAGLPADTELVVVADPAANHPFHTTERSDPVTVGYDETKGGVDLECPEGGTMVVRLDYGSGDPVPTLVFARNADGEPKTQMVQSSTEVTFEGLAAGTWTVSANRMGGSMQIGGGGTEVEVVAGEEAEVTLTP